MKIVHTKSGKAYELNPGTQLDIERPNLFFNEWGEQSLPTDLPDTDLNRSLTGYPDMLANQRKPQANIECVIQDGDYHMPCRQAVLGAKRLEKISTSFYMNEGSFLARISDVSLSDVFGNEVIPGISTVRQGIDFCFSLRDNKHPVYSIFPIIVDLDGQRRIVNRFAHMDAEGNLRKKSNGGVLGLYNSFERKETVNDRFIKLEPGYYISPFVRASFVLRRIFQHFGYTLLDHFLLSGDPFGKMVFINNTIDSLVNGDIMLSHLLPDCMCSTILNVYRRRFCCEFIPDEVARTVRIELFNDIVEARPSVDLTPYLVSRPEVSFPEYRQLKLSSENVLSEGDTYNGAFEIEAKYPEAWYHEETGGYYRTGYTTKRVVERLSDGNIPYYAGGPLKAYEVKVPDSVFSLSRFVYTREKVHGGWQTSASLDEYPYIGEGRTLNSTLEGMPVTDSSGDETDETDENGQKRVEQKPVLALVKTDQYKEYVLGANHNVAGYSLLYNGAMGIYEKFYRKFDNLLRNSMHKVSAELLLPDEMKNTLSAHEKISLQGVDMLFDTFRYTIGGEKEPVASDLLTVALYEPVSLARREEDRMKENTRYKWIAVFSTKDVSREEYLAAGYPEVGSPSPRGVPAKDPIPTIYPLPPTEAIFKAGGTYFHRTFYRGVDFGGKHYWRIDLHLRPALYSESESSGENSQPSWHGRG